ncbi:hypothetical protein HXX01_03320 [Candidatus Nomurabacteria bacterium]|nr:hypothetical protein [Candidatus Nomurabacteria bacterium]
MSIDAIYITLDYELFFGSSSGTVEKCLLEPTKKLIDIGKKYGVRFTFFVDTGMLCAMRRFSTTYPELGQQYQSISDQIQLLKSEGHSLQLHIHPHWEDSIYSQGRWVFDVRRYRLDHFGDADIERIIFEYKNILDSIVGDGVRAFRAGGWCIQPFSRIGQELKRNGITIDSTIYRDGVMSTITHKFDFRRMPLQSQWRFEDDPLIPVVGGSFTEIPISVSIYSRWFYFKMFISRFFKIKKYRHFGDGSPVGVGRSSIIKKMLFGDLGVVSLDGFRSCNLNSYFSETSFLANGVPIVVIGHPKALCSHSIATLEKIALSYSNKFAVL